MKNIFASLTVFGMALIVGSAAHADFYKNPEISTCRVYKMVDYTYFEEGLSPDEYPDVDVKKSPEGDWQIQYGSHEPQVKEDGYDVKLTTEKTENGPISVVTTIRDGGDVLRLEIEGRTRMAKARIRVKESGQTKFRMIGYAICSKGFLK